uniref:Alpha-macroglobulin receptor-binding domain-containing protein n=1 Tax=Arion vulgaris TaxID=1028688 RepID=A0A0B7BGG4_9EUPU
MSSVTNNIENLLTQPYGCGEQNLMNLAPDIYLLKFLLVTGTATDDSKRQAKEYIEKGLQTQLQFEHGLTGGYSAFGTNDKVASLWLTSAVARVFAQLARLNNEYGNIIDTNVSDAITRAKHFMIYSQNKNGSFTENGIVFHPDMQGGSAEGEALTSYALISLVEAVGVTNGVSRPTTVTWNQKAITLAADYLASRISFMNDPFVVCITTYALHLAKHQSKDSFFNKMEQIAINEDVYKYWESSQKIPDNTVFQMSAPTSALSIEATSYALLTYILRDNSNEARLPILRWLISKRNPNGGFISTQDTIVCLEALSRASVGMYKPGDYSAIVTISYSGADGKAQSIMANINKENENILQRIDIPYQNNAPSTVFVTANTANGGSGPSTVIFDVGLQYNIKGETLANCFKMWHILQEFGTRLEMTITIMALSENATSMSILDVEIAAGYTVDLEEVATNNSQISRVDPYNGKNLIMYFNSGVVNNNGSSVTFNMYATSGSLTKAYPRSYTFYDYYFPNCRQTNIYTLDTTPTCTKVPKFSVCPYVK